LKAGATDVLWQFSKVDHGPARDGFAARRKGDHCASMDDETKPTDGEAAPRMDGASIGPDQQRAATVRERSGW